MASPRRLKYSLEDDRRILKFLNDELNKKNPDAWDHGGNRLWEKAVRKKITCHSMQSMRDHTRRQLIRKLDHVNVDSSITENIKKKLALNRPTAEYDSDVEVVNEGNETDAGEIVETNAAAAAAANGRTGGASTGGGGGGGGGRRRKKRRIITSSEVEPDDSDDSDLNFLRDARPPTPMGRRRRRLEPIGAAAPNMSPTDDSRAGLQQRAITGTAVPLNGRLLRVADFHPPRDESAAKKNTPDIDDSGSSDSEGRLIISETQAVNAEKSTDSDRAQNSDSIALIANEDPNGDNTGIGDSSDGEESKSKDDNDESKSTVDDEGQASMEDDEEPKNKNDDSENEDFNKSASPLYEDVPGGAEWSQSLLQINGDWKIRNDASAENGESKNAVDISPDVSINDESAVKMDLVSPDESFESASDVSPARRKYWSRFVASADVDDPQMFEKKIHHLQRVSSGYGVDWPTMKNALDQLRQQRTTVDMMTLDVTLWKRGYSLKK